MFIDWDSVFAMKVWQWGKWVTGVIIISIIVYGLLSGGKLSWVESRLNFIVTWSLQLIAG